MDSTTVLLVLLGVVALFLVVAVGTLIWLVRTRPPGKGVAAALAALAYAISPIDAVPEVPLGLIGLIDDIAVVVGAVIYIRNVVAEARRDELTRPGQATYVPPAAAVPHQDSPPKRRARR